MDVLKKDARLKSVIYVSEHNIEDAQHRELLQDFYSGKVANIMWESWQLYSYYDVACKNLLQHVDSEIIFWARSFIDVMNFVNIYVENELERADLYRGFEPCLNRILSTCKDQSRKVLPVILTADTERCWQQFQGRGRVDELNSFTSDKFARYKLKYEESALKVFDDVAGKSNNIFLNKCILSSPSVYDNVEQLIACIRARLLIA